MKAATFLVEHKLPPDLRDPERIYDQKGVAKLMAEVAMRYPDKYAEIAQSIVDAGRTASWEQGETLTLNDMRPVIDKEKMFAEMDAKIAQARKEAKSDEEFADMREDIWADYVPKLEKETGKAALAAGNNLGYSVVSGARGKAPQLQAMLTTPGVYTDSDNKVIPLWIRKSYNEGLRPAEWLAGTYGARLAVVGAKRATAAGGDFGKIAAQAGALTNVVQKDCGTGNGIDVSADNLAMLRGRVLARDTLGYPEGTLVTREIAQSIVKSRSKDPIIVRSPLTCQSENGLCAKCVGAAPGSGGKLPKIGDAVGITAANAITEPIAQGALNTKHVGGQGKGAKREFSGFEYISQFAQIPEEFNEASAIAQKSGTITAIRPAPQGGQYVDIGDEAHYVPPGFDPMVRVGQDVEEGDQLSDGLINPAEIVKLRGLGEGRRYYAERLGKLLSDSGYETDPKNTEILARAAINHVTVDAADGYEGYLPDDVVQYSRLAARYSPPDTAKELEPAKAVGRFLQIPVLHYTVGTRITKSMADKLHKTGFDKVVVDDDPPPFQATMVRLRGAPQVQDDWLAQQHTSYLKSNLADAAVRGRDTNVKANYHFAPRLAVGKDFASNIEETGQF